MSGWRVSGLHHSLGHDRTSRPMFRTRASVDRDYRVCCSRKQGLRGAVVLDERQRLTGREEGSNHECGQMGPMDAHFDGSVVRVGCALI